MDLWLYLLVGLLCGVFGAAFGVGGGVLLVPVLVLLFQADQKSAQGMALGYMAPMALVAFIRYKYNEAIPMNLTITGLLALGGMIGALFGSWIAGAASGMVLRRVFAVIMIAAAVRMFMKPEPEPPHAGDTVVPARQDGTGR